jgi:hypothetical protein
MLITGSGPPPHSLHQLSSSSPAAMIMPNPGARCSGSGSITMPVSTRVAITSVVTAASSGARSHSGHSPATAAETTNGNRAIGRSSAVSDRRPAAGRPAAARGVRTPAGTAGSAVEALARGVLGVSSRMAISRTPRPWVPCTRWKPRSVRKVLPKDSAGQPPVAPPIRCSRVSRGSRHGRARRRGGLGRPALLCPGGILGGTALVW